MEEVKATETMEEQIKRMIVRRLGLDMQPEEIEDDMLLFDVNEAGEGLDLDSVDALELAVGIKELFGVKPQSTDLSIFNSVRTIAEMLRKQTGE